MGGREEKAEQASQEREKTRKHGRMQVTKRKEEKQEEHELAKEIVLPPTHAVPSVIVNEERGETPGTNR